MFLSSLVWVLIYLINIEFVLIGSIVLIVMGSVYIKDDKISDEKEHERQEYLMKK